MSVVWLAIVKNPLITYLLAVLYNIKPLTLHFVKTIICNPPFVARRPLIYWFRDLPYVGVSSLFYLLIDWVTLSHSQIASSCCNRISKQIQLYYYYIRQRRIYFYLNL